MHLHDGEEEKKTFTDLYFKANIPVPCTPRFASSLQLFHFFNEFS